MGLLDIANRGIVGGLLGAPVDMSAGVVNAGLMGGGLLGHQLGLLSADQLPQPITEPVGGSEWFGRQMQNAGMVSPERQPLAEFLASMAIPAAGAKSVSGLGLLGAMSPDGKTKLLQALREGFLPGRTRLGDVTEGQGKGLDKLFGRPAASRDVHLTDDALRHIVERRMQEQGFSPEDVTRFTEQAMARRSKPDLNVAKGDQHPSLLGSDVDPQTGRPYSPRMPLKATDDGYEVRSVIPEGLRPRNNKAPKR